MKFNIVPEKIPAACGMTLYCHAKLCVRMFNTAMFTKSPNKDAIRNFVQSFMDIGVLSHSTLKVHI